MTIGFENLTQFKRYGFFFLFFLPVRDKIIPSINYVKHIIYHCQERALRRNRGGGLRFSTTGTTFSISCLNLSLDLSSFSFSSCAFSSSSFTANDSNST
uniref:Uncharacterized protein n=1 Tax=Rhizophora mucronata TaxID=61149 RepID=A0A2P2Q5P1_RHIMU